jgi:glycosyltransferase involved in cell wall biosynthesis/peptidoglycan/xylan/chitin deacetylase (PgdA/CDA1 family)
VDVRKTRRLGCWDAALLADVVGAANVIRKISLVVTSTAGHFADATRTSNRCSMTSPTATLWRHVAVVPTLAARSALLARALASVSDQVRLPDRVLVVLDGPGDVIAPPTDDAPAIEVLRNRRTRGLSGALNTALDHLLRTEPDPERVVLSFLDDDDWWEPGYLAEIASGRGDGVFLVGALVRHDRDAPGGRHSSKVGPLLRSALLVGNPGVQGSNLSVALADALRAGGFDEALPSCTDRDFVIRLLDLGLSAVRVASAIAHHDTTHAEPRLSDREGEAKRRGLDAFFAKYRAQMSADEQRAFESRGTSLFGWSVPQPSAAARLSAQRVRCLARPRRSSWLAVVGVIVDGDKPERAVGLLDDLSRLSKLEGAPAIELVLLANGSNGGFASVARAAAAAGLRAHRATRDDQVVLATALGLAAEDLQGRATIAVARTLLHQFVHAVGSARPGAFAWILDDDLRLPDDLERLVDDLWRLRESGFDVAIGRTSGAPPIPASAMIRTQLVDVVATLRAVASQPLDRRMEAGNNLALMHERRDYYHDLARLETDRLEVHFVPPCVAVANAAETLSILAPLLPRVFAGEAITRPVLDDEEDVIEGAREGHLRGGNTLVFRWSLLQDELNLSPRLRGRPVRRSDMLWACDVHRRRGATVRMVPLTLRQDRSHDVAVDDWGISLIDDVLGYAFFRSYDECFERSGGGVPEAPETRGVVLGRARKLAAERFAAAHLSFWRCQGLGRALGTALDEIERAHLDVDASVIAAWRAFACQVSQRFASENLDALRTRFDQAQEEIAYAPFLDARAAWDGPRAARDTAPWLEGWAGASRADLAALTLGERGARGTELLGMGGEGVVFRDGDCVLKVFDRWSAADRVMHESTLRSLLAAPRCPALPEVRAVAEHDGTLVVTSAFEPTTPYAGGQGAALVGCLRALRAAGWVHTNICPDNLRRTAAGLQIVDLGRSLEPTTPPLHDAMIRRAFLTWRFSERSDLGELLRRSNTDGDFAACVGWEVLRDAVSERDALAEIEARVTAWVTERSAARVLDLGAGKPRALHRVIRARLHAFDPDPSLSGRWAAALPDVPFSTAWPPTDTGAQATYDRVLCARVLCAVGEDEMLDALRRVREALTPEGEALIVVCDPTARKIPNTPHQHRTATTAARYACSHAYAKEIAASGRTREEHHRPLAAYRRAFARAGLMIVGEESIETVDLDRLERVGEAILFRLRPLPISPLRTALVVKVCAQDAPTAARQISHLTRALGAPRAFDEVVVALDPSEGPFARAHGAGDLAALRSKLAELVADGIVDRIVDGPATMEEIAEVGRRWFGLEPAAAHARNGQATCAFLRALDSCSAELVLHSDVDSLVARPDPTADIIDHAIDVFARDEHAVTLALPVAGATDPRPLSGDARGPFRVETQLGWVHRARLERLLPLPNETVDGVLQLPWHRALDRLIQADRARSIRAGSRAIWYCSPDNARKHDPDALLLAMTRVEQGACPAAHDGHAAMMGPLSAWLGPARSERLVVVACGRNVGEGKLRRFVESLMRQSFDDWGLVFVDDGSDDGSEEVIDRVLRPLGERVSLVRRGRRVGALANIVLGVRSYVALADAVIVLADPDDAIGASDALARIADAHAAGADVTVGSMVRTDKETSYVVDFDRPRQRRGGSVWQHLRTFRRSLFDRIEDADLRLDGEYVDLASDWAFMLPIVEMALHPVWLRETLYLHEPSSSRRPEERAVRDANIARIVTRPSYCREESPRGLERLVALAFHRVLPADRNDPLTLVYAGRGLVVRSDTFERQLRRWARDFDPVTLRDVLLAVRGERTLPARPLLITFDDGYRDFVDHALPIAQRLGLPLSLFARTPCVDGLPSWAPLDRVYAGLAALGDAPSVDRHARAQLLSLPATDQLTLAEWGPLSREQAEAARQALYLSETMIRALTETGVSIGSHGCAHVRWSAQEDAWLASELDRSRAWLSSLPHGVAMISYPDGAHDRQAREAARARGFAGAFTLAKPAGAGDPTGPFAVPRHIVIDDPAWDPPVPRTMPRGAR